MNKSKMVDIELTQCGVNVILNSLNSSMKLRDKLPITDSSMRSYSQAYLDGMLHMLQLLDIEAVFDGDSYVGLLARVEGV